MLNSSVSERNARSVARSDSTLRFSQRRRAVSDIIGTILILAITVTLFSSIFFFVSSFPGPPAQSTSQFNAKLGIAGGNIEWINVTYVTGPDLPTADLEFFISSNTYASYFGCSGLEPYSLSSGLISGAIWVAGETWTLQMDAATLCAGHSALPSANDNITVSVLNVAQDLTLLSITLPGTVALIPPQFVAEGYGPVAPVAGDGPFYVWAQIRDSRLPASSNVFLNLTAIPGPLTSNSSLPSSCGLAPPAYSCVVKLTLNATTGLWSSPYFTAGASVIGKTYPVLISATDSAGLYNAADLSITFSTPVGANLNVSVSTNPGNPVVKENTTLTAVITNDGAGGGVATVVFSTTYGTIYLASQSIPISPFASGVTVNAFWIAQGKNGGPGEDSITVTVTLSPSFVVKTDMLTVFPRTLLVDGTGVPIGSTNPLDTFTYLTTDFTSAAIPFTTIVAPPGSTTVTFTPGSGSSNAYNLNNYDVVVWDMGNSSSTCLSSQDAWAIANATFPGLRSVWLMGGDAFSCSTSNAYLTNVFGLKTASALTQSAGPLSLSLYSAPTAPTAGITANNISISSEAPYETLTPLSSSPSATPYLCLGGCSGSPPTNAVATAYNDSRGRGNAFATSFELPVISEQTPLTGPYQLSTGEQASVVYDVFSWLANFTSPGSPPTNARATTDWAVSEVVITPTNVSYQSPTQVRVTIRDNGPATSPVTATLLVNGQPYSSGGVIQTASANPAALGGSNSVTIVWDPTTVGWVTICASISPPTNDSVAANNELCSSLFSVQIYVAYSVIVVDATLPTVFSTDDTSTVVSVLETAGFPAATIHQVSVGTTAAPCATVSATLNQYNLVVWNDGIQTNSSGKGCPLSNANANLLASFLANGGAKSALLFLGNGLLSDNANAAIVTWAKDYLGITIPSLTAIAPGANLYGATGDMAGNGVVIPYVGGAALDTYCGLSPPAGVVATPTLYFNSKDYWNTGPVSCSGGTLSNLAASEAYSSSAAWHSAYWGFNLITATSTTLGQHNVSLLALRQSTAFGRILPGTDTVVSVPDVTFATTTQLWTNFDNMHPELEQQYLVRANVTNLEGGLASNTALSVYDGTHILGSQTLSIGGSTASASGLVSLGVAQLSVAWTPLYAGLNQITVQITSSTASQTIPGVENRAAWNVTVYFFYDSTNGNTNSWTHSQTALTQANVNPTSCDTLSGGSAYLWEDINVPEIWSKASGCSLSSTYGADTWGMNYGACFSTSPQCGSLAIKDGISNQNTVTWTYSSPFTLTAGESSAVVNLWQEFNLALYASGGIFCVVPSSSYPLAAGNAYQSGTGEDAALAAVLNCANNKVNSPSPTYNSPSSPDLSNGYGDCYGIPTFTGGSAGGTGGWQQETLNLTSLIPNSGSTSYYVAFGFIEGDTTSDEGSYYGCGGAPTVETGWNIDSFSLSIGGGPTSPVSQSSGSCPSSGSNIPADVWQLSPNPSSVDSTDAAMGTTAPPTGTAFVAGAWSGSTLVLDPNMWDSLYSRPIDLSSATAATLNFNYLWSDVYWEYGYDSLDYLYGDTPNQDFILQIAPTTEGTSTAPAWVQVWSANDWSLYQYSGSDSHFLGYISGSNSIYDSLGAPGVAVSSMGWHSVSINLNAYLGQVIQLRFLVGTNCGATPSSGSSATAGWADYSYPMVSSSTGADIPSGAMLSGINITGTTSISSNGAISRQAGVGSSVLTGSSIATGQGGPAFAPPFQTGPELLPAGPTPNESTIALVLSNGSNDQAAVWTTNEGSRN